jgi:hypothetical protein
MSKTTQNDLLECIGKVLLTKLVDDIRHQSPLREGFYGLQADEVTDLANWEQLAITIRYLKDGKLMENVCSLLSVNLSLGQI